MSALEDKTPGTDDRTNGAPPPKPGAELWDKLEKELQRQTGLKLNGGVLIAIVCCVFLGIVCIFSPAENANQPSPNRPNSTETEAQRRLNELDKEARIEDEMAAESIRRELMPHVDPAERRRIIPTP
jgi:hypothetical protein